MHQQRVVVALDLLSGATGLMTRPGCGRWLGGGGRPYLDHESQVRGMQHRMIAARVDVAVELARAGPSESTYGPVAVDIGAAAGGFTSRRSRRRGVYAVDVVSGS